MDGRCETCKYWRFDDDDDQELVRVFDGIEDRLDLQPCQLHSRYGDDDPEQSMTLALSSDSFCSVRFWTPARFGCVQWESDATDTGTD